MWTHTHGGHPDVSALLVVTYGGHPDNLHCLLSTTAVVQRQGVTQISAGDGRYHTPLDRFSKLDYSTTKRVYESNDTTSFENSFGRDASNVFGTAPLLF